MKTRSAVLQRLEAPLPYAESRPLVVEELDLAEPQPGELLVRVAAAGLCHSDLSVINGSRPRPTPMALGHEAAGVVERVGAGVADVVEGDHVVLTFVPSCGHCDRCSSGNPAMCRPAAAANGEGRMLNGGLRFARQDGSPVHTHLGVSAFSELTVVSRGSAVVIDRDIPLDTAVLVGCGVLTGVGAVLNTGAVRPGDSVVVFGMGGVGLSAVMGAALASATPLIAIDPVPAKRELALQLGATAAFAPDEAEAGVKDLTGGGADFAIECVGISAVMEQAYRCTGPGGTTIGVGLPHPSKQLSLQALSVVAEGRTLKGSYMGSAAPQRDVPRLLKLWRAGRLPLEKLRAGDLALDAVNEAMDTLHGGETVRQLLLPNGQAVLSAAG
ncbi:MAG: alcohol dehydrogenase catalytic domain-containing protein [Actinomycetota bacterium]|jgi:alcohol dehydrogenase|nr:alcohol dehydrogenase catalytic domain-containing protein [Actinomycetota bacterium]